MGGGQSKQGSKEKGPSPGQYTKELDTTYQDREPKPVPLSEIRSFVKKGHQFEYDQKSPFNGLFASAEKVLGDNPVVTGFVTVVASDAACRYKWAMFGTGHKEFWHSSRTLGRSVVIVLAAGSFQMTGYSIQLPAYGSFTAWKVEGTNEIPTDPTSVSEWSRVNWDVIDECTDEQVLNTPEAIGHWDCVARCPFKAFRIANISDVADYMGIWRLEFFGNLTQ